MSLTFELKNYEYVIQFDQIPPLIDMSYQSME